MNDPAEHPPTTLAPPPAGTGLGYQMLKDASTFAYTHLWSSVVVLTVASMVLYYVVGLVESGSAQPWPPCAATDSGCHSFQVASRDS